MTNRKVEKMIERAVGISNDNNHEYITLEHVLLSLLHEKEVNELVLAIGGNPVLDQTRDQRIADQDFLLHHILLSKKRIPHIIYTHFFIFVKLPTRIPVGYAQHILSSPAFERRLKKAFF